MEKVRVRLTGVRGDQEDFADLIGAVGTLGKGEDGQLFMPEGRGDFLSLASKRVTRKGDEIKVSTKLGNTFVFRVLGGS